MAEPRSKKDIAGFRRLPGEVDKIFLELLRGERVPRYARTALRPNADVYYDDRKKAVVVKLELPGIDPDVVSLEVEEGVLRVSGVRSDQRPPGAVYQQMEISYGPFERTVLLPPKVDATKASASYSNGYLEILLPVRSRAASKRIPITLADEREERPQQ